jgi:GNAT superfamily N-acetyltransferase
VIGISLRRAGPGDLAALEALQHLAFAPNRALLGVEPLPLLADYRDVIASKECWLLGSPEAPDGALILEPAGDALMIWSIAVAPRAQNTGTGRQLMDFAETRARQAGFAALVLYTGEPLVNNIAWYGRLGFAISGVETLADRRIVHMKKPITAEIEEER